MNKIYGSIAIALGAILVALLASCAPSVAATFDAEAMVKKVNAAQAAANQANATIAQQAATIATLQKDVAALKASQGGFITQSVLNAAIANTAGKPELDALATRVGGFEAGLAQVVSRQNTLTGEVRTSLTTFQNQVTAQFPSQFVTQSQWYALQGQLAQKDVEIADLKSRLTAHGW